MLHPPTSRSTCLHERVCAPSIPPDALPIYPPLHPLTFHSPSVLAPTQPILLDTRAAQALTIWRTPAVGEAKKHSTP